MGMVGSLQVLRAKSPEDKCLGGFKTCLLGDLSYIFGFVFY